MDWNLKFEDFKIGDIFTSNNYGDYKILDIKSWENILVEFTDGTQRFVSSTKIRSGQIKNPNKTNKLGGLFRRGHTQVSN